MGRARDAALYPHTVSTSRHFGVDRGVVLQGRGEILQQAQLAGAGDGFRAAFDLQLVEDAAVVPFHVSRARNSRSLISRLESPCAMRFRISNSRSAQRLNHF